MRRGWQPNQIIQDDPDLPCGWCSSVLRGFVWIGDIAMGRTENIPDCPCCTPSCPDDCSGCPATLTLTLNGTGGTCNDQSILTVWRVGCTWTYFGLGSRCQWINADIKCSNGLWYITVEFATCGVLSGTYQGNIGSGSCPPFGTWDLPKIGGTCDGPLNVTLGA